MQNQLYDDIKNDADSILADAQNGCQKAINVITLHQMCVAHADNASVTFLGCAYDDWKELKKEK